MNNESLQYELTHLCNLAAPPYRACWIHYVKAKARGLAEHDPATYSELPSLLKQALDQSP